ncbi:hypothetical protein M426DRAFT_66057 [Hypoxylon sp. CI-4A]|nr:hypothetical protein M426DRAFT_66057 [Hypoxylon sp. CI-4A]
MALRSPVVAPALPAQSPAEKLSNYDYVSDTDGHSPVSTSTIAALDNSRFSSSSPIILLPPPVHNYSCDNDVPSTTTHLGGKHFKPTVSNANDEWTHRKATGGEESETLDALMEYEGLERVKQQFLDIKSKVDMCKEQGRSLASERFSIVFQGNPGTGKTTIASLYGRFLKSLHVFEVVSWHQETISGSEIVNKGSDGLEQKMKRMVDDYEGGVLIIDEAYQLVSPQAGMTGRSALDIILTMMEANIGKLAVVFLGYKEEMESFFEHNPGLSSRIPYTVDFDDFTDYELWKIWCKTIADQYNGKMEVEGGMGGLYVRCIIRRLSAGRGRKGFGNARAVQNLLNIVTQRQARRLVSERRAGENPNLHRLTKQDLLGPNPSTAIAASQAWCELQDLIGLEQVKESVRSMVDSIEVNYRRELCDLRPIGFSLNQVFIGEPGTGKTTVARLYGRILADLGYLSRGDVMFKTAADFIGDCLGKSETQTRAILESSVGKVLIIDEAYMLDPGSTHGDHDKFKTGVIDTIVSMVQGQPFEDRCIILIGYEDKINAMFRNANLGLSRRFPVDQPFRFTNFTIDQLLVILQQKMKHQDLNCSEDAVSAAREIFKKDMRGNCTNAGIVDHALERAKMNYTRRISKTPSDPKNPNPKLEAVDFSSDLMKTTRVNCHEVMHGQIDEAIIDQLESYQKRHWKAKALGISAEDLDLLPTRFLFNGPRGTGKTTTARLLARLYFEMGYLSVPEVIEYSATDLIGQYVGHTGQKTREKLENAVGRLVFIDDAPRLLNGAYETQAVNELTRFLSQPMHQRNIVVILAGDKEGLAKLVAWPAVSSVFSDEIAFNNIPPEECIALLSRELASNGIPDEVSATFNPRSPSYNRTKQLFTIMQSVPSWENARDVKHLARQIRGKCFDLDNPSVQELESHFPVFVLDCMEKKIKGQKARTKAPPQQDSSGVEPNTTQCFMESKQTPPAPAVTKSNLPTKHLTDTDINVNMSGSAANHGDHAERPTREATEVRTDTSQPQVQKQNEAMGDTATTREEGVSDEIWEQVQKYKIAAEDEQSQFKDLDWRRQQAREALIAGKGADVKHLRDNYIAINKEYLSTRKILQQREKIQEALRRMGRCVYGYSWTREGGGYRCEGGMHFVSDAELHSIAGLEN